MKTRVNFKPVDAMEVLHLHMIQKQITDFIIESVGRIKNNFIIITGRSENQQERYLC